MTNPNEAQNEAMLAFDKALGDLADLMTLTTPRLEDAVTAFEAAYEAERRRIGRGIAKPGQAVRKGLLAAFATLGIRPDNETNWQEYAQEVLDNDIEKLQARLPEWMRPSIQDGGY